MLLALMVALLTHPQTASAFQRISTRVVTTEGALDAVQFESLDADKVVFVDRRKRAEVPVTELKQLVFSNPAERVRSGVYAVKLVDGSQFYASNIASDGEQVTLNLAQQSFQLNAKHLLTLRLRDLDVEQERAWGVITESATNSDVLVLVRPTGSLTKVEGIIVGIEQNAVRFELDGEQIDVAFEKLAGVRFFAGPTELQKKIRASVSDVHRNQWFCATLESAGDRMLLGLQCGAELELPLERLMALDFSLGSTRYLAELEPIRSQAESALKFGNMPDGAALFGMRPLPPRKIPGQLEGPSLKFVGSGEAVFEIPEGFQAFTGAVQLEPQGNKFTPCVVEVYLENKLLFERRLSGLEQVEMFELAVNGGDRLRLVVTCESVLPTGNVVLWREPRLLK